MARAGDYSLGAQVWALRVYGGVDPRTFRALIGRLGSPANILSAEFEELMAIERLGNARSREIFDCRGCLDEATYFIDSLQPLNIKYSTIMDEDYPDPLRQLSDAPPILFYRGVLPASNEKIVSIFGAANADSEGIRYAVELASRLGEKSVSIVSGLGQGIQAAAHIGAMKRNARTYAVLNCGLENIQPKENSPLAAEIVRCGGIISEYHPDAETKQSNDEFREHSRLVAGISQAVIIAEASCGSADVFDMAAFCADLGKIMFILIDRYDMPGQGNSSIERIISMGAIPFSLADGIGIILRSLV
jgi:DNA processing protein